MGFHRPINGTVSGVVIGDPVTGGVANSVLIVDASGDISQVTPVSAGTFLRWNGTSFDFSTSGTAAMVIGNAVTGGTDPAVLFIQGGALAQDPTNFRWVPSTSGLFRLVSGSNTTSIQLSPTLHRLSTTDGTQISRLNNSSPEVKLEHLNTDTGLEANMVGGETVVYQFFNNQIAQVQVTIEYSGLVGGPFEVGETIVDQTTLETGTILSDDGSTIIIDTASPLLWVAPNVIEQTTGTNAGATATIDNSTPGSPHTAIIGVFDQNSPSSFAPTRYFGIVNNDFASEYGIFAMHDTEIRDTVSDGASNSIIIQNNFNQWHQVAASNGTNSGVFSLQPDSSLLEVSGNAGSNLATVSLTGATPSALVSASDGTNSSSVTVEGDATPRVRTISTDGTRITTVDIEGDATPLFRSVVDNGAGTSSTFLQTETVVSSSVDVTVPDEAYGSGWNGSFEVPTKNAIFDAIQSALYSPTASNISNLDATPTVTGRYMRIGSFVQVSGTFLANPTAAGVASFDLTLPVASNFATSDQATGSFTINGAIATWEGGSVNAEPTGNLFHFEWQAANTAAQTYYWQAMYQII